MEGWWWAVSMHLGTGLKFISLGGLSDLGLSVFLKKAAWSLRFKLFYCKAVKNESILIPVTFLLVIQLASALSRFLGSSASCGCIFQGLSYCSSTGSDPLSPYFPLVFISLLQLCLQYAKTPKTGIPSNAIYEENHFQAVSP